MRITSIELKNQLDLYLDAVKTDPIMIEKSGSINYVLISYAMYKQLINEDAFWPSKSFREEKSLSPVDSTPTPSFVKPPRKD